MIRTCFYEDFSLHWVLVDFVLDVGILLSLLSMCSVILTFLLVEVLKFLLSWVTVYEFKKLRKKLSVQYIVFYFTFIFPVRKVEKVLNIAKRLNYMT